MSQRERLMKWWKDSKMSFHQFNTAALQPITLCEEDPARLYLWIHLVELLSDAEFIFTARGESGSMVLRGGVNGRTDFEFSVDKQFGLTTAQWVFDPIGSLFFITVIEDVYKGA